MEKAKHTPTPWISGCVKTSIGRCFKIGAEKIIDCGHGAMCLYDDETSLNPLSHDEIEANAAFIVRAVNNHDALVEALGGLLEAQRSTMEETRARFNARSALSKSKGE